MNCTYSPAVGVTLNAACNIHSVRGELFLRNGRARAPLLRRLLSSPFEPTFPDIPLWRAFWYRDLGITLIRDFLWITEDATEPAPRYSNQNVTSSNQWLTQWTDPTILNTSTPNPRINSIKPNYKFISNLLFQLDQIKLITQTTRVHNHFLHFLQYFHLECTNLPKQLHRGMLRNFYPRYQTSIATRTFSQTPFSSSSSEHPSLGEETKPRG